MQKRQQPSMLSTYSHLTDSHLRSLVIGIHDLHRVSPGNYATYWGSNRIYQRHTTCTQTDNQNGQTSGWNNIFTFGQMSVKITGQPIFLWWTSLITIGQMKPHASPPSFSWWDTNHMLTGQTAHCPYCKWRYDSTSSNRHKSALKNSWSRHSSHGLGTKICPGIRSEIRCGLCSGYISALQLEKCERKLAGLQLRDPRLASFIQGQEESVLTTHKGKKAKRTSWILQSNYTGVYIHFGCTT